MTAEPILAWHFVADKLRDGRPIPADGVQLVHRGNVIPCEQGLHASVRIIDALAYAPGGTICRVSCAGRIVQDDDKLVCSERTILWRLDATDLLREFARRCALDVAHLWNIPDIVRRYLETGDETIRAAALDAAWAAVRAAAQAATWAAALDAAWAAVRAAAQAATRDAARSVAHHAARDATRAATWAATQAAARAATRAAAQAAQNTRLETMVQLAHAKATDVAPQG